MSHERTKEACRRSVQVDGFSRPQLYRAWRVCGAPDALPLDIGDCDTLADAKNEAMLGGGLCHKDTLLIHRRHDGLAVGELYAFAVKQKSQAVYRKCEATGMTKPFKPLYLAELFSLPVNEFEPTRPFDAFRDDAVGVDRTLVDAQAMAGGV